MNGSLKIARFFDIPVYLHWTFGLIFVYVLALGQWHGWGIADTLETSILFIVLFICVVMHEFGHALTARRFGIETRDIILSPVGGIARLNYIPKEPIQEFLIAIAGPAVNFGIVLFLAPFLLLFHPWEMWQGFFKSIFQSDSNFIFSTISPFGKFFFTLLLLNLTLAVFNLIPAFPMDGGRVLRALLSIKFGRLKATRAAAFIGQVLAVFFFSYGLLAGAYILAFIGVFVFVMAFTELNMVRSNALLSVYRVEDVMRSNFTRLYTRDTIGQSLLLGRGGGEKNFLVFDERHNLKGTIRQQRLLQIAREQGEHTSLENCLQPISGTLLPEDNLQEVFFRMHEKGESVLPVFDKNKLIGLVDIYTINYFLAQKQASYQSFSTRIPSLLRKYRQMLRRKIHSRFK